MRVFYDLDGHFYGTEEALRDLFEEEKADEETCGGVYCYDSADEMINAMLEQGWIEECDVVTDMTDLCPMYYYSETDSFISIMELYAMYLVSDECNTYNGSFAHWLKWSDGLYGIRRSYTWYE